MLIAGSIDIGSNTIRMLIVEGNPEGPFREIASDRKIIRLGEGINEQKRLLPHRMEYATQALSEYAETFKRFGDIPVTAVATSAVREASNKDEFLQMVKERTGLIIEVIPWEQEASLTLKGALWQMEAREQNILTFDIGGGSTEFISSWGKEVLNLAGTSLGVVRLTEKFIARHPADPEEISLLREHLQTELASVKTRLKNPQPDLLIGTAGTVTTLAALHKNLYPYDPEKIHRTVLSLETIQSLFDDLKGMSLEERKRLKPLEPGREDLIIAGTAIVLETMSAFSCVNLTVSEYGLREGILLKTFERLSQDQM